MKLRGIGDVLGQVQSGLPQFNLANFVSDQVVLQQAQADVKVLLAQPYPNDGR